MNSFYVVHIMVGFLMNFTYGTLEISSFQSPGDFKITDCGPNYTYVCTGFLITD